MASPLSIIRDAQIRWTYTEDELREDPPSLTGNPALPYEAEAENRAKAVTFITQVGLMLKIPQPTLYVASVFMHRFFVRNSMIKTKDGAPYYHHYDIAGTALFLASKCEEHVRKLDDIVVACVRVGAKKPELPVSKDDAVFWKWRDVLLYDEDVMLESLCFDLTLESPYEVLSEALERVSEQESKKLQRAGWAFLNDSMFTKMCLLYIPQTVAAAALYFALRSEGEKQPGDWFYNNCGHGYWASYFNTTLLETKRACNYIARFYENHDPKHSRVKYRLTPEISDPTDGASRARCVTPPAPASTSDDPAWRVEHSEEGGTSEDVCKGPALNHHKPVESADGHDGEERQREPGGEKRKENGDDHQTLEQPLTDTEQRQEAEAVSKEDRAESDSALERNEQPVPNGIGGPASEDGEIEDGGVTGSSEHQEHEQSEPSQQPHKTSNAETEGDIQSVAKDDRTEEECKELPGNGNSKAEGDDDAAVSTNLSENTSDVVKEQNDDTKVNTEGHVEQGTVEKREDEKPEAGHKRPRGATPGIGDKATDRQAGEDSVGSSPSASSDRGKSGQKGTRKRTRVE